MKEIKREINKLIKSLESMRQTHSDFLDKEFEELEKSIYTENNISINNEGILSDASYNMPSYTGSGIREDKASDDKDEILQHILGENFKSMKSEILDNLKEVMSSKDTLKSIVGSYGNKYLYTFHKNFIGQYQSILNVAINLNKLLDKPIKKVQSLEEIQHKKMLSVLEVELLYGFSKTQQQGFRGRLKNALPHHKQSTKSKSANTKVYYKKNEIDDWIGNFL